MQKFKRPKNDTAMGIMVGEDEDSPLSSNTRIPLLNTMHVSVQDTFSN